MKHEIIREGKWCYKLPKFKQTRIVIVQVKKRLEVKNDK